MVSSPHRNVRGEIVEAATRSFAARGFGATSVQDVADAVGLTKQAVLHHFPSKGHVRAAVLESLVAHWSRTLPRLLVAASASEGRFSAVFGELCRFFAEDPDRAKVVMRELLDRPDETRATLATVVSPWLSAIAAYIEGGRRGGRHWPDVDPEAYVLHVLLLVVAATTAGDVTAPLLGPTGARRRDAELARIAHAALFRPDAPAEITKPRARTRARATTR